MAAPGTTAPTSVPTTAVPSGTDSFFAPSELPVTTSGDATPMPKKMFPPYPPYATEPAPASVVDAIMAGRDIRVQHKSVVRKPAYPIPRPAKPKSPKATDVKMSKKAERAHARCLRRHGAVLTDRLERMSKPQRRAIIYMWRERWDTLPPETIARFRSMLNADEPFKPDQAYEYFVNLRKTKKKLAAQRGANDVKRDLLAVCADKRFVWARNATVAFARGIQQRLKRPGSYALADGMLRLSDIVLEEICSYLNMRPPSRRSTNPKARFMMEMADKIAVWIDEIMEDSDDRMLMMDFDEDAEILAADGGTAFTDDFLDMMGGGGRGGPPGKNAHQKLSPEMQEAFNVLTNAMQKKGNAPLVSYGAHNKTYNEAATRLKNARDFTATRFNPALANELEGKLSDTASPVTPENLRPHMKELVDICSKYLAQDAEENKHKGNAFKLLTKAMREQPHEVLVEEGRVRQTNVEAAKILDAAKNLETDHDDPNLSQKIHSNLSKLVSGITPDDTKSEMAETLGLSSKYLSQNAIDQNGRGPSHFAAGYAGGRPMTKEEEERRLDGLSDAEKQWLASLPEEERRKMLALSDDERRKLAALPEGERRKMLALSSLSDEERRKLAALPEDERNKLLALSDEERRKMLALPDEERRKMLALSDGERRKMLALSSLSDEERRKLAALPEDERNKLLALSDEERRKMLALPDEERRKMLALPDGERSKMLALSSLSDEERRKLAALPEDERNKLLALSDEERRKMLALPDEERRKMLALSDGERRKMLALSSLSDEERRKLAALPEDERNKLLTLSDEERRKMLALPDEERRKMLARPDGERSKMPSLYSLSDEERRKLAALPEDERNKLLALSDEERRKMLALPDEERRKMLALSSLSEEERRKLAALPEDERNKLLALSDEERRNMLALPDEERRKMLALSDEERRKMLALSDEDRRMQVALLPEAAGLTGEEQRKLAGVISDEQQRKLAGLSEEEQRRLAAIPEEERRKLLALSDDERRKMLALSDEDRRKALALPEEERRKLLALPEEERRKMLALPEEERQKMMALPEAERQKMLARSEAEQQKMLAMPEAERLKQLALPEGEGQKQLAAIVEEQRKQAAASEGERQKQARLTEEEQRKLAALPDAEQRVLASLSEEEKRKMLALPEEKRRRQDEEKQLELAGISEEERRKLEALPEEERKKILAQKTKRAVSFVGDAGEIDPEHAGALNILHSELKAKGNETFYKQPQTELTHRQASDWLKEGPPRLDKTVRDSTDTRRLSNKFEKKLGTLVTQSTPTQLQDAMEDVVIESSRRLSEIFVSKNYKSLACDALISEMQKRGNEILIEVGGAAETFFFAAQRLKLTPSLETREPCTDVAYRLTKKLDEAVRCRRMARKLTSTMKEHVKDAADYLSEVVTKPDEKIEAYVALLGEMEAAGDNLLMERDIPKSYKDCAAYLRQLTSFEDRINKPDSSLQSETERKLKSLMSNITATGYSPSVMDGVIKESTRLLVSYIKLQGEKTESLKVLVELMDQAGDAIILRHGTLRKNHSDGANLLRGKNTDQLSVQDVDPVVARKIQIKLTNLVSQNAPNKTGGLMDDVIDDATAFLAVNLLQPQVIKICKCMKNVFVQCELWCDEILRRVGRPCCSCSRHASAQALADVVSSMVTSPGSSRAHGLDISFQTCDAHRSRGRNREDRHRPKGNVCPAPHATFGCQESVASYYMYDAEYDHPPRFRSSPTRLPPQTPSDSFQTNFTRSPLTQSPFFSPILSPTRSVNLNTKYHETEDADVSSTLSKHTGIASSSTASHSKPFWEVPAKLSASPEIRETTILENVETQDVEPTKEKHVPTFKPTEELSVPLDPAVQPVKNKPAVKPDLKTQGLLDIRPCSTSTLLNPNQCKTAFSSRAPIVVTTDQMLDWHALMVSLMWNMQAWREWIQENINKALNYKQDEGKTNDEEWSKYERRVSTEALQWRQYNVFSRQLFTRLAHRYRDKHIVSPTRTTVKTEMYKECEQDMIKIITMFNRWTHWLMLIIKETNLLTTPPGCQTPSNELYWRNFKTKVLEHAEDWVVYDMYLKCGWEEKYNVILKEWFPAWEWAGPVWVVSTCGAVPSGAVAAGIYEGEVIWLARTTHRSEVLPAALHPSKHSCLLYADGVINYCTKYQVMCNASVNWVAWRAGEAGARAVRVAPGVHVGRVLYRGSHLVGAVRAPLHRCQVIIFDRQFAFNCYELLVLADDPKTPTDP